MGILFTRMFSSLLGNREARILVLSLDNAGKTTFFLSASNGRGSLHYPKNPTSIVMKYQNFKIAGHIGDAIFLNTQPIIYVIDSSNTDRIGIAKEEFHAISEEEELKGAAVLIFSSNQDLPGSLDDAAVTEALDLHKIRDGSGPSSKHVLLRVKFYWRDWTG